MEMMDMAADDTREELRRKLRSNFDGRIVRKDLTKLSLIHISEPTRP